MLVVKDVFAVDFVLLVVLDMVVRKGSLIYIFFCDFCVCCLLPVMRTLSSS